MAIKMTPLRKAFWKVKCYYQMHSLVPPAFWVGFWFASGAYWAFVLIGFASNLSRYVRGLFGYDF